MVPTPWRRLSGRAQTFYGAHATRVPVPDVVISKEWTEGEDGRWASFTADVQRFNRDFAGLRIPVLGGPLAGEVTLGTRRASPVWRLSDGMPVFRAADHDSAQCALVISADGVFGCSWAGEFTPLFDSLDGMLEDVAMWGTLQGWHFAISDAGGSAGSVVTRLGDVRLDEHCSGNMSRWWMGDQVAVSCAPFLNPGRSPRQQISVLVRDRSGASAVRNLLMDADLDLEVSNDSEGGDDGDFRQVNRLVEG